MTSTSLAVDILERDEILAPGTMDLANPILGEVPHEFLERVLKPYIPANTDYLRSARVVGVCGPEKDGDSPIIAVEGSFSIPSSCYIQSTGHFNAVEFLICFNQLAYTTIGYAFSAGFMANLPEDCASKSTREKLKQVSLGTFFNDQLSSMLILKTETRFQRIIDASNFIARLTLKSIFSRADTFFTTADCEFTDAKGGRAEGTVLLAYVSKSSGLANNVVRL